MIRKLIVAAAFSLTVGQALAAGSPAPTPIQRFEDNNGNACVGCQVFVYAAGTTTPATVYTDTALSVPFPNPILLNSRGEPANPSASAVIFLTPGVIYKFVLAPSTDTNPPTNPFWTADNISALPAIGTAASQNIGTSGANLCLLNANCTFSGVDSFTNAITIPTVATTDNSTNAASTAYVQNNFVKNAPLFTKTSSIQTSNYTVTNTDDHTYIYLNSSGVGGKTLTISPLGSYTDTQFSVGFCNQETRVWTIASADAGSLKLYPKQCNTLHSNGSVLVYERQFQPYVLTAGQLINIAPAGSCNNANDGLVPGPTGAVCSFSVAVNIAHREMICVGGSLGFSLSAGTFTGQTFFLTGWPPPGCGNQLPITGVSAAATIISSCISPCFDIEDGAITTISNLLYKCDGVTGIFSRGTGAIVDLQLVVADSCVGGSPISIADGGHVNMLPDPISGIGLIIQGSASTAITVNGAGSLISATSGLSVTSNPITMTGNFLTVLNTGYANMGSIVGGGAVTGTKWAVSGNGVIATGSGNCNTFFNNVGTVNGSATTGGQCF